MNAYKKYVNRQIKNHYERVAMENCDAYVEHMDLIILHILHTEFGFGAQRLRRVFGLIEKRFNEYRRFVASNDKTKFNEGVERDDTWALKYHLRQIGFDYDEEVKKCLEESESNEA